MNSVATKYLFNTALDALQNRYALISIVLLSIIILGLILRGGVELINLLLFVLG